MKKILAFLLCLLCLTSLLSCGLFGSGTPEYSGYATGGKYYLPTELINSLGITFHVSERSMTYTDRNGNTVTCHYSDGYTLMQQICLDEDGGKKFISVAELVDDNGLVTRRSEIYQTYNNRMLLYTFTYDSRNQLSSIEVKTNEYKDLCTIRVTQLGGGLEKLEAEGLDTVYRHPFGMQQGTDVSAKWSLGKQPSLQLTADGTQTTYALTEVSEAEARMFHQYYDYALLFTYLSGLFAD